MDAKLLVAEMEQVEVAIRDFEGRAAANADPQDDAFQEAWDQAVQRWWELAERLGDGAPGCGEKRAETFLMEIKVEGDVL